MDLLSAAIAWVLATCPPDTAYLYCLNGGTWLVGWDDSLW